MKLNTGAMLKAVGVGLVISLVMFGIGQVVNSAAGITAASDPQDIVDSGALGSALVISGLLGCVGLILYGIMGAIYGWFAGREQALLDVGQTALGGGLTAAIVAFIATVISTLYTVASGTFAQTLEQATSQVGDEQTGAIMAGAVGGIVIGFCISFVLSAGLGAAGGAIYAAVTKGRQPQPQDVAPGV